MSPIDIQSSEVTAFEVRFSSWDLLVITGDLQSRIDARPLTVNPPAAVVFCSTTVSAVPARRDTPDARPCHSTRTLLRCGGTAGSEPIE